MDEDKSFAGLKDLVIGIKGGGDLATGIALSLFRARFQRIFIMETEAPTTLRRRVAFASALYETTTEVEGVAAVKSGDPARADRIWARGQIPVFADPRWRAVERLRPSVLIDAVMAKRNLGTRMADAPLTIALGPGFKAGEDVHLVIETRRGHNLGRLITRGSASANTSRPEAVMGITEDRLVRSPETGTFTGRAEIGDAVRPGQILGHVDGKPVRAKIRGVVRGLVHDGVCIPRGRKIADVDPRGDALFCRTVSDKARAMGGAVLEAVLGRFNR